MQHKYRNVLIGLLILGGAVLTGCANSLQTATSKPPVSTTGTFAVTVARGSCLGFASNIAVSIDHPNRILGPVFTGSLNFCRIFVVIWW